MRTQSNLYFGTEPFTTILYTNYTIPFGAILYEVNNLRRKVCEPIPMTIEKIRHLSNLIFSFRMRGI